MSPAPWHYHTTLYGNPHCIADKDGRLLATHVQEGNGQLMAAAPALFAFVAAMAKRNDDVGELAREALHKAFS